VVPGQASPVSGLPHQAILSGFEQYSLAVEDIADDAEAAAATAVASCKARAGASVAGTAAASTGDAAADVASESAEAGCSLGQILRARFDSIMTAAGSSSSSSAASAHAGAQQGAEGAVRQPAMPDEVAAWLASDSTGLLKQSFAEGWGCRWVVLVYHDAKLPYKPSCSICLVARCCNCGFN
jgi:hypothetical protein